jgi:hypothetical protein
VLPVVGLPGLPANQVATITTSECFRPPTPTGIVIATGTFIVTVGSSAIGAGTLIAFHQGCYVTALFEGKTLFNQEFAGLLTFNCGAGKTIVHFDDVGTVTVSFTCTAPTFTTYTCTPGTPEFVPAGEHD